MDIKVNELLILGEVEKLKQRRIKERLLCNTHTANDDDVAFDYSVISQWISWSVLTSLSVAGQ